MFINWKLLLFIVLNLAAISPATAYYYRNEGGSIGTNSYLFIENNVDDERVIMAKATDPRFSGANTWTKYSTNQVSLGYMGYAGWHSANTRWDYWITDSPISQPFLGIRCFKGYCDPLGYRAAEVITPNGFAHTKAGSNGYNGYYGWVTFSPEAYEYFREKTVGDSDTFELNLCYVTEANDEYSQGVSCTDMQHSYWYSASVTSKKIGHLTLNSTGALAEIWVASDGTPSIAPGGSNLCKVSVVDGVTGVVCKMIDYQLKQTEAIGSLYMQLVIDTAALGFTPGNDDAMISGDGATWSIYRNYVYNNTLYSKLINTSSDSVYLFLSNDFFKKILTSGKDTTNKDSLFTFSFNNTSTPESGFYQFTPSSLINIYPKEYGISIVASDGTPHLKESGTIGSTQPIEFEYRVRTSSARQADSVTVQVTGDSTTINSTPYCLFSSADGTLSVPIPAYLSFTSSIGGDTVTQRNSCAEAPIDITSALWEQTAWDASMDSGYFFTTTVKLLFPMDDIRSQYTVSGEDWMGTVSASGEIKATATWIGVE